MVDRMSVSVTVTVVAVAVVVVNVALVVVMSIALGSRVPPPHVQHASLAESPPSPTLVAALVAWHKKLSANHWQLLTVETFKCHTSPWYRRSEHGTVVVWVAVVDVTDVCVTDVWVTDVRVVVDSVVVDVVVSKRHVRKGPL